ncbi:DNA polymerase subunit gamma-1 [Thelohanellus kitauei]|uniref:Mitochondrial DNA polymerase catalytic subunit n=1 Tax=Thelohanellus kitauei TaxID=669202 RepID=A0A0C2MGI3_THEKT|nr:DNA polymerase subunit gamma-1 [Thelohanellus kitauei]
MTQIKIISPMFLFSRFIRSMSSEEIKISFPQRFNQLNIQMISPTLHRQLFKLDPHEVDEEKLKRAVKGLITNNLLRKVDRYEESYNFPLPKLLGSDLEEHYFILGWEFCLEYFRLAVKISECTLPQPPSRFLRRPGWIRYLPNDQYEPVDFPDCDVLMFDVETSVQTRNIPVAAVAVSDKYWYCWLSSHLFRDKSYEFLKGLPREVQWKDMIPLGPSNDRPRLIIGHNVSFDRSYVKEEYLPQPNFLYYLDTMSLHILLRGFSDNQRILMSSEGIPASGFKEADWRSQGSFNSLSALCRYYLKRKLDKSPVKVFIESELPIIFREIEKQLTYCLKDVETTWEIFKVMFREYYLHAPHPLTFSGMLMMSKCYIPITENWKWYIESAQNVYLNYETEMDRILTKLTQRHVSEGLQGSWAIDPCLKNLDWSIAGYPDIANTDSFQENSKILNSNAKKLSKKIIREVKSIADYDLLRQVIRDMKWFPDLPENINQLNRRDVLAGYPNWFKKLTNHKYLANLNGPRPSSLNHNHRIVPFLLKLCWNGYPLHYHSEFQWGYLLPKNLLDNQVIDTYGRPFEGKPNLMPYTIKPFNVPETKSDNRIGFKGFWEEDELADELVDQDFINERLFSVFPDCEYVNEFTSDFKDSPYFQIAPKGFVIYDDIVEENYFVPIPHPDGLKKLCGNPLGNDYSKHIIDGHLAPMTGEMGMRFIQLLQTMTFWKNNRDRIINQNIVYFKRHEWPPEYTGSNLTVGAIVPRIVPSGTVTRRAVERTWLTAVNPQIEMIGSEFKAAVFAPDGFCFVGADVDSEEMWIASLIADASTVGIHGATPFSYMNIQGSKARGTDLHTVTAEAVGIDRDDAKILNYGRLYGAGMDLARSMIQQYQPHLTENEATIKAVYLYNFTKGIRCVELTDEGLELTKKYNMNNDLLMTLPEFSKLMKNAGIKTEIQVYGRIYWQGGTESEIFNILEEFTQDPVASTPFLNVAVPKTLSRLFAKDDFITSRMNWVVQSSAVDFLHTFLVTCYWLFSLMKVPARLVISIHDEIRFMVPEDKRYEAAMALHVANLFTRASFAHRLGIHDLPQSVAFFSGVDIDKVLRKEPKEKCITPSNPEQIPKRFKDFQCKPNLM